MTRLNEFKSTGCSKLIWNNKSEAWKYAATINICSWDEKYNHIAVTLDYRDICLKCRHFLNFVNVSIQLTFLLHKGHIVLSLGEGVHEWLVDGLVCVVESLNFAVHVCGDVLVNFVAFQEEVDQISSIDVSGVMVMITVCEGLFCDVWHGFELIGFVKFLEIYCVPSSHLICNMWCQVDSSILLNFELFAVC